MATTRAKILVVDDDPKVRDVVHEYLAGEGFVVEEASEGETMRAAVRENRPDIVLLDVRLPGDDGLSLARELREMYPDIGILMISGKEELVDRVAGLEVGADDYIVKPFHLREVLARVRSVLRRHGSQGDEYDYSGEAGPSSPNDVRRRARMPATYHFSGWMLDSERRTFESSVKGAVELTRGEFDLLLAFLTHPNTALSRDQLLDYARNRENEGFDRSIDVQVGRLRRKIEENPKRPVLIKTIRNVGYMFTAQVMMGKE